MVQQVGTWFSHWCINRLEHHSRWPSTFVHEHQEQSLSHLVRQVDPDETNNRQARSVGEHHVKCYVRNVNDSKKRLVGDCKHWPLIREIKQPSSEFGDIIVLRPNKVEEILAKKLCTRGWHQGTVNLAEQGIIGPFNFAIDLTEQQHISEDTWKAFEACAEEVKSGSVNISDLNE
jgi:hypothetical protein